MDPAISYRQIPVTVDLGGQSIGLGIHEVTGAEDGPTLSILAGLHGDEWMAVEVIRRLLATLANETVTGRVRIVPVGNPVAFTHLTRNTPFEASDGPDLNRIFGSERQTINARLARAIDENVMRGSDVLIDLHFGIWGSAWLSVDWPGDLPDQDLAAKSRGLAYAYGCPLIFEQSLGRFPGTGSALWHAATTHGTIPLAVEIGGCGFSPQAEESWIRTNVDGLLGVMRKLGMLDGEPVMLDEYLHYRRFHRMEPSVGGYLVSNLTEAHLGAEATAGTVAGRVLHATSLEELEVITAPANGVWRQVARSYPTRPGGWGFAVADLDDPDTGWRSPW